MIVDELTYQKVSACEDVIELVKNSKADSISIIDGMQRTTAMLAASEREKSVLKTTIRVELWISCEVNSMLYRMLVLNTCQVPWNMRRQVELIFDGVIKQIEKREPEIEIIKVADNQRRRHGGQYNANDIVEMFLAFGARTWKIDTKERVTDEFTRGDFVQSTGDANMVDLFCKVLSLMFRLDIELENRISGEESDEKFKKGQDLFASQPAKVGFSAACGEIILGRPGEDRSEEQIASRFALVDSSLKNVLDKIESSEDPVKYIDFSTLSGMINTRSTKVGDYEREKFYSAFKVLFEMKGEMESFTMCWRA